MEFKRKVGRPKKVTLIDTEFDNAWANSMRSRMGGILIGQNHVIDPLVRLISTHKAGLSPEGRPAGIAMLLGSSGSGKTMSAEALAECLHGSRKSMLKIDCGEYQMEHEVAKLIGAPPGYLGHRETQPLLTQFRLNSVASERSAISIVLLDEIEKAADSMKKIFLGVMDKGNLRLGDNTTVSFENSIILFTSNVGTKSLNNLFNPMGYSEPEDLSSVDINSKVRSEFEKEFSPEFRNRIDHVIVYNRLTKNDLAAIFKLEVDALCEHILRRSTRRVEIVYPPSVANHIANNADSIQWGAREIKRIVQQKILTKIVDMKLMGSLPERIRLSIVDGEIAVTGEASA